MSKNIYMVSGYIPSDENKVYMHIHCLIKTKYRFVWVNCINNHMIGGATDNPGYDTLEEALMSIHAFTGNDWQFVHTDNFEDVLIVYEQVKKRVSEGLKKG
jgi:hypothetical protein